MPAPQITRDELVAQLGYEYEQARARVAAEQAKADALYAELKALARPGEQFSELSYEDMLITVTGWQGSHSVLDDDGLQGVLDEDQLKAITRPKIVTSLLDQAIKDRKIGATLVEKFRHIEYHNPSVRITIKKRG